MNLQKLGTSNDSSECQSNVFVRVDTMRALFVIAAFLLAVSPILHAEDQYADLLNLEFKQQTLHGIDANESLQDDEKLFRHNRHYLSDMLKSYSQQTLSFIGLPDQTAKFMGATIGFVTRGAKLDLNDSKTLAIEFKDVVTHDPALYFGYKLDW
jgi:hypothetical protein